MSYKITLVEGDKTLDRINTANPNEAEAHYFRLIKNRTTGAGAVKIYSDLPEIVAPGYYRLDEDWAPGAPREQEHDRWRQIWAEPETSPGPTTFQIQGLKLTSGLSTSALASLVGVDRRSARRWVGGHVKISYSVWYTLLSKLGY